jgi:hypothetical protein
VAGSVSDVSIVASVQPASPSDLQHLPDGDRSRAAVKIYTDDELRTANESSGLIADKVVWLGEQWEVQQLQRHVYGIAHYKALAFRVER